MRLLLAVLLLTACSSSRAAERTAETAGTGPVVVELFTSQGCSSCPSADRLLKEIGAEGLEGRAILPLAFHVDYWNDLGWRDPFSSERWTERQRAYSAALGSGVYTPELVIGGAADAVGSARERIARAVRSAATPAARVALTVTPADRSTRRHLRIDAEVLNASQPGSLQALVAVFENHVITRVTRGENSGRKLENDYIVRRLDPAFTLDVAAGARRTQELTIDLDPSWDAAHLGVVVFLQDRESLHIRGAASAEL